MCGWNCSSMTIFYLQEQQFNFCSNTHKSCTRWGVYLLSLVSFIQTSDSFLLFFSSLFQTLPPLLPLYSHDFSCPGPGLFPPVAFFSFSSGRLTKYGRSFHRRWLTLPALLPRGPHFPVTQGWQIWSSPNRKWSPVTQHVFLLCPHLQLYFPLSFLYSKTFRKRDDPQISPSVGPW